MCPAFAAVPFGDMEALQQAIGPETGAILLEPIQGEGGIRPFPRRRCCAKSARCATVMACCWCWTRCRPASAGRPAVRHEHAGVTPDILAAAKGIGAGYPSGAVLATARGRQTLSRRAVMARRWAARRWPARWDTRRDGPAHGRRPAGPRGGGRPRDAHGRAAGARSLSGWSPRTTICCSTCAARDCWWGSGCRVENRKLMAAARAWASDGAGGTERYPPAAADDRQGGTHYQGDRHVSASLRRSPRRLNAVSASRLAQSASRHSGDGWPRRCGLLPGPWREWPPG